MNARTSTMSLGAWNERRPVSSGHSRHFALDFAHVSRHSRHLALGVAHLVDEAVHMLAMALSWLSFHSRCLSAIVSVRVRCTGKNQGAQSFRLEAPDAY